MSRLTDIIFAGQPNYLTSGFGWRQYTINGRVVRDYHAGSDYGTHGKNLPLYTIEGDGYVYSTGYDSSAGNYIWIWYNRLQRRFAYFHMQSRSPLVKGQKISAGMKVGNTGTTGNSNGIHLHLGIRDTAGNYYDPEAYAKSYSAPGGGSSTGGTNVGGSNVPYFKIFTPMNGVVSSQQLSEGVIALKQNDGKLYGYNLNGASRMAKEYTASTKSKVFEAMKAEMKKGEIMASRDK